MYYNYLYVDDLLISFFFYLINVVFLLINIFVERYIYRCGIYILVLNKGVLYRLISLVIRLLFLD